MIDLVWPALPMIILLGVFTSRSDISINKIMNRWIVSGLAYASILYAAVIIYLSLSPQDLTISVTSAGVLIGQYGFASQTVFNVLAATVIGVALWLGQNWSAADGKLFIAYSALLPVTVYSKGYTAYFPAIALLVNTYIILFVVVAAEAVVKMRLKHLKKSIGTMFRIRDAPVLLGMIFGMQWLFQTVFRHLPTGQSVLFSFIMMLIIIPWLSGFFARRGYILLAVAAARIVFDPGLFSSIDQYVVISISYFVIRMLVIGLSKTIFSREIKVSGLKRGMVMSSYVVRRDGRYEVIDNRPGKGWEIVVEPRPDGLDDEDLKKLRGIKDIQPKNAVVLNYTFFAPYIFAAVIITILVRGNIINYVMSLF